jgi:phosphate starvation-inducible PhoH-like protein
LVKKSIEFKNMQEAVAVCGRHDENVKLIEKNTKAQLISRGNEITIEGEAGEVERLSHVLEELIAIARGGQPIRRHELKYAVEAVRRGEHGDISGIFLDRIEVSSKRRFVTPKTRGQKRYVDAIREYDIVFGIGPAGTGKTYLAMAMAVSALKKKEVNRIILTRPAVEAGETLGFLPGDLSEKITPYLRPLYDALYDMMEIESIQKCLDQGIIEVAPLAYMRGRTLNDAFIILDEAQNSTSDQMKMFLTRLGFDSKTVITGDITQVDLPRGKASGLIEARSILKKIKGIEFVYFDSRDVVRHELVQKIIKAYEKAVDDKN